MPPKYVSSWKRTEPTILVGTGIPLSLACASSHPIALGLLFAVRNTLRRGCQQGWNFVCDSRLSHSFRPLPPSRVRVQNGPNAASGIYPHVLAKISMTRVAHPFISLIFALSTSARLVDDRLLLADKHDHRRLPAGRCALQYARDPRSGVGAGHSKLEGLFDNPSSSACQF